MILLLQDCLNGWMKHDTEVLGLGCLGCWAGTEATISKAANRTHCPYCDNSPSQNEALAQFTVGDSSLACLSAWIQLCTTIQHCSTERLLAVRKNEWHEWLNFQEETLVVNSKLHFTMKFTFTRVYFENAKHITMNSKEGKGGNSTGLIHWGHHVDQFATFVCSYWMTCI